jgi:hypothetical protein
VDPLARAAPRLHLAPLGLHLDQATPALHLCPPPLRTTAIERTGAGGGPCFLMRELRSRARESRDGERASLAKDTEGGCSIASVDGDGPGWCVCWKHFFSSFYFLANSV